MHRRPSSYLFATCHPWACLVFLLPLLVAYEAGIIWYGGAEADALRNGADNWLRHFLETAGLRAMIWPPILIVIVFVVWNWLRSYDRPVDMVGVWVGMAVESIVFAMILWGMARAPLPDVVEAEPTMTLLRMPFNQHLAMMVSFVGAGIYEELLFRLMLYPLLRRLFSFTMMIWPVAVGMAMIASSIAFAGAHHIGPYGEPFDLNVFGFRTAAGLYFAMLFQFRGFGIVVGTHACYDVLVGVAMSS